MNATEFNNFFMQNTLDLTLTQIFNGIEELRRQCGDSNRRWHSSPKLDVNGLPVIWNSVENYFLNANFERLVVNNEGQLEPIYSIVPSLLDDNEPVEEEEEEHFSERELAQIEYAKQNCGRTNCVYSYHYGSDVFKTIGILKTEADDENSFTFGFESEFDQDLLLNGDNSPYSNGDEIDEISDIRLGHWEKDASIKGIEFVSNTFTLNKLIKCKDEFDDLFRRICDFGLVPTSNDGLHIHIGRKAFKSKDSLRRFFYIFNNTSTRKEWFKIARRLQTHFCNYFELEPDRTGIDTTMENDGRDHYSAVNLGYKHNGEEAPTVEVRIFKSTLSFDLILAYVELLQNLIKFCNNLEEQEFTFNKILDGEYVSLLKRQYYKINCNSKLDIRFLSIMSLESVRARMMELLNSNNLDEAVELGNTYITNRGEN